ncbi:peptide ABC transporter substrate-binding protein [Clostridia bacterium]|nr:peptide ABC transporter substrate-binding protein [Clostridia bacterium]
MKKLLSILLVLAFMVTMGSGCQGSKESAEELPIMRWNIGADPKTIDPGLNGASEGGDVVNQTFEALTREKSGIVYPGIAETWDISEDGKTVTFHLRESKWSDGSPLTANDFVYSWKRAMAKETASEYSWIWEYTNIVGAWDAVNGGSMDDVGIAAIDDLTFEVKLTAPTDYIVQLLSFYHFMPVKQSSVESGSLGSWAKDPELAISNGPFVLTSYTIGEEMTFRKNENYWNADAVKLGGIDAVLIDESATAYQAFESGELDFIPDVPPAEIPRLIAEDQRFYVFPLLGTYYYNINMDLEMWQDIRVRKALTLGIDRELICETLASGQVPAAGFVPPGFLDDKGNDFFMTAGTYGLVADDSKVAEAQELLAEAGYPGGEGFPEFTIVYNTSEAHQAVAELVQEMFKTNLGINCNIENQEWAVFQDTRKEGDYQMSRGGWLTDFMDPMGLLAIFTTENTYNDPNFSNADYDAYLEIANNSTSREEHFNALYAAQEILIAELPIIPIYHYSDIMMASPKLKDWDRSVLGTLDFSNAYLEE